MSEDNALVPVESATPAPAFTGAQMGQALAAYRDVQHALDVAMPDQIMTIQGRPFRKKGYWRAVARAFRLRVECVQETLDKESLAVTAVYRATAPSGDSADGDGACAASEKREGQDSLHNVRAHAHTRAYNRAVSNLVGFGEVSAEEMDREPRKAPPRDVTPPRDEPPQHANGNVTEAQQKRFWALCSERAKQLDGVSRSEIGRDVLTRRGIEHTREIPRASYEQICAEVAAWDVPTSAPQDADAF